MLVPGCVHSRDRSPGGGVLRALAAPFWENKWLQPPPSSSAVCVSSATGCEPWSLGRDGGGGHALGLRPSFPSPFRWRSAPSPSRNLEGSCRSTWTAAAVFFVVRGGVRWPPSLVQVSWKAGLQLRWLFLGGKRSWAWRNPGSVPADAPQLHLRRRLWRRAREVRYSSLFCDGASPGLWVVFDVFHWQRRSPASSDAQQLPRLCLLFSFCWRLFVQFTRVRCPSGSFA